MKDKYLPEDVASSFMGSLVTALKMVETINKTCDDALEIVADYHKVLLIGILDGLSVGTLDIALKGESIQEALDVSLDGFKNQDPSFVNKTLQDLRDKYNKQHEILNKIANDKDIGKSLLYTGDKLLGKNDLHAMLAAAEKLTNKMIAHKGIHQDMVKTSTAIKAASNVIKNELVSKLFFIGQSIGQGVASNINPSGEKTTSSLLFNAIKDTFLIYDYVSNIAYKTIKLPSKLLDMGIGACIALVTGVIDATIDKENSSLVKDKHNVSSANQTYLEQLKETSKALEATVNLVYTDFMDSYSFQKGRLRTLDEKVKKDQNIGKILAQQSGKNPKDLEALKSIQGSSIRIAKPLTDTIIAGTKAIKGTILSTSFNIGRWIGIKCFANKNSLVKKTSTVPIQDKPLKNNKGLRSR